MNHGSDADFGALVAAAVEGVASWREQWDGFESHPSLGLPPAQAERVISELLVRLRDNYPFFHPRYAGQMLKPPHPIAVAGYLAAMLINPNNHALDGGPATAALERETVIELAAMFHFPEEHLGHLTSSGTIANLEALFVARETHPGRGIAHSADAHYTHQRMAHLLGLAATSIPTDDHGRMDVHVLEKALRSGTIGTVVATAGTTGTGAIDPIDEIIALRDRYEFRVHVDAAYGGFFTILAWAGDPLVRAAPLRAIAECDSVVVDPHKHGLQPYGCGAVLFRDPAAGRWFRHDSPYTYFTSPDLHLGEISLECSRAGAAAAAFWATLRAFPLTIDGLGAVLSGGRRAALAWHERIARSDVLTPVYAPDLDIVTFYPTSATSLDIDRRSQRIFEALAHANPPVYVSVLRVAARTLRGDSGGGLPPATELIRVLRSVLMKPEHEHAIDSLHEAVEHAARTEV